MGLGVFELRLREVALAALLGEYGAGERKT
jgi:hypothetical protein